MGEKEVALRALGTHRARRARSTGAFLKVHRLFLRSFFRECDLPLSRPRLQLVPEAVGCYATQPHAASCYLWGNHAPLTTPGSQRFSQATHFEITFGGAEANVAVAIAQFGARPRM